MTAPRILRPDDLEGDPVEVAPTLLGRLVCSDLVTARIVEVEAYRQDDPASHSFRGRTTRTEPMFDVAGTAYVYLSHGVHWCLNVTVGPRGVGAAVLLRAAAVESGEAVVRRRRGASIPAALLLRGPGNLGRGLGLDGRASGADLLSRDDGLWLADDGAVPDAVGNGPRVGIRHAADRPWRWWWQGRPEVSAYRRHPAATA